MAAPPPHPSSYRPWEDTASSTTTHPSPIHSSMQTTSTAQTSYLNGRPSLPPLPMTTSLVTDRRPVSGASTQGYSGQNSRKRRRLSDESEGFTFPSLTPSPRLPQRVATATAAGRRGGNEGGSGNGSFREGLAQERDGGRGGEAERNREREEQGSAYAGQNQNRFHLQNSTGSRPGTPARGQQQLHPLSVLVSSIHNLVLDLTAPSQSPSHTIPAQITPHQIPSIETLTTCLETVSSLLLRLKSPTSQSPPLLPPPPQLQHSPATTLSQSHPPNQSPPQTLSTVQQARDALQKTNKSLQAAHTRSQARAATLNTKLAVCMEENENLANAHERLQGTVENLEQSLAEVREERNEIRMELRRSGAQWGRILVNAGRLAEGDSRVEKGLRGKMESLREEVEWLRGRGVDGDSLMGGMESRGLVSRGGGSGGSGGSDREVRGLKLRVRELERNIEEARRDGRGVLEMAEKLAMLGKGIIER
ncbi:unnamed protein product [Tuber aestivum]|uniref:Uncharacterized protein n=1 Tax=Tuber aestivum TaxID=59557 RepID=A0A292PNV4_9PEZI|nr:unnamed protein product [Tuber aestivum]